MKQLNTIEKLKSYIKGSVPEHFRSEPGVEAYQFYLDKSYELESGTIADLGTYQGLSALALSANPEVNVLSYDIDLTANLVEGRENITFIEGNVFDFIQDILQAKLILLDLDPHDGIQEDNLIECLIENNYHGTILCDDINKNIGMKNWWHKLKLPKKDVSEQGHWSGTGVIYMD